MSNQNRKPIAAIVYGIKVAELMSAIAAFESLDKNSVEHMNSKAIAAISRIIKAQIPVAEQTTIGKPLLVEQAESLLNQSQKLVKPLISEYKEAVSHAEYLAGV